MPERARQRKILQMLLREYHQKEKVPSSAIYECSECNNITAFKKGETFTVCPDCTEPVSGQGWYHTDDLVHFVSRNLNVEFQRAESWSFKVAEFIADFAGNVWFVYFHALWFILWILANTGNGVFGIPVFDPYPFPFLVLVVSLEAIFLATFILIAQNIQGARSELRADIDYQVNLKTEKDVAEMVSILNDIREGRLMLKGKKIVFEEEQRAK